MTKKCLCFGGLEMDTTNTIISFTVPPPEQSPRRKHAKLMGKSFKTSNAMSVRFSPLPNASSRKIQRMNTQSVIVSAVKNNQIVPAISTTRQTEKASEKDQFLTLSFQEAFGVLGYPMLVTLAACISWTNCLICVTLLPNQVANWLMGTNGYHNGQFWLIIDTDPVMIKIGAVGLVVVNACYLYVVVKMLCWRNTVLNLQRATLRLEEQQRIDSASNSWVCTAGTRVKTQYVELTSFRGSRRKFWNVCLKVFNLTMQMTVLLELLEIGNPEALVYGYTALISLGSLAGAAKILIGKISAMGEVIAGCVFDLFAAIIFPVLVLVYCYYNFQFDDAVFATYLEILPVGSFERSAAVLADPSEVALFRSAFDSLRIKSALDFILRVGINLSFCYRLKRIGDVLVVAHLRRAQAVRAKRIRRPRKQKPVPRVFAVFFIAFSVVVWMVTNQAITDSHAHCSHYAQCVVYAYRWKHDGVCPCRILIDVDRAPKTYDEWINPVDVYSTVQALALSGELRSLQLINRQLLELPSELQSCRHLSSLELIYTGIQKIPSWAKEFKYLQILHLEGKVGSQNLLSLPEDLFSDMPWLSTVHIGIHPELSRLPPLSGVPNLRSVTLAWLLELRTLPSFNHVSQLQSLVLGLLPHLEQLPDMAPLQSLQNFTISRPIQLCCNGFRGTCDLTDNYCVKNPSSSIPAAFCFNDTPFLGHAGTQQAFERFNASICQKLSSDLLVVPGGPTKQTIEVCDSKPFARCERPDGGIGICYNTRMQVLSCYGDENYIKLRRYQIQKDIGQKCDPALEGWLGCRD
ncbi:hypothetical protein F441_03326 [Phytophthora nicotianae CJ01A1]|uniref:WLGC domain-containing protein n=1 Tax=Phytophthora nicotianae CJ01A1 TaxID=1317063 RepID=W2XM41_PHYNI|nr:hypothetical protein F441_03326 [Phytophthora nicotianae CJ01A1]